MIPASIRNRNPGAQYPGASSKKFGSTSYETLRSKDGVHKIATFPTHEHGAAAQFDLLVRSYTGMTIKAAVTKWCGGFYASTYVGVLEARAGITADTVLTKDLLAEPEFAIPLARAMAWQEAGRDYPMEDEDWLEAHQMAFGAEATAPEWAPGNDVPTPKAGTRQKETVKAIAKHPATVAVAGSGAAATVSTSIPRVPAGAKDVLDTATAWQALGKGFMGIGREVASVVMMTGRLWPYALVASVGASGLGYLYWKRTHG